MAYLKLLDKDDPFKYFAAHFAVNIRHSLDSFESYLQKFKSIRSHVDRVDFIHKELQDKWPKDLLTFEEDTKDDEEAVRKREQGNDFYKTGNCVKALECYTASISLAKDDHLLALAFANRSAVLFRMKLHEACLVDIERAFKHGFPDKWKPKLIKRQEDCQGKTSQWRYYEPVSIIPESERNKQFECARNCVETVNVEPYGFCVVATRDIKAGELLSVEEAFVTAITDEMYIHCHHCLELCYNPIPCNSCTRTLYCSENCKERAFESYHKYQCHLLAMVLAWRNEWQGFFEEQSSFKKVMSRVSNWEKRTPESQLLITYATATIFRWIKTCTTFFQDGFDESRFKEILLTAMAISHVNGVNIKELGLSSKEGAEEKYNSVIFAAGVYYFLSFFNHSCDPNVNVSFHGTTLTVNVVRTIKKGEQCFLSYGTSYGQDDREKRRNFLFRNYSFICNCRACEENWPKPKLNIVNMLELAHIYITLDSTIDPELARFYLKQFLNLINTKKGRKFETTADLYFITLGIERCFSILGNKRRITNIN